MVRIDMSNVAAREKAFGEYGDTVWLVYILFSERLKQHKREQNLTNVQIAGFKDTAEYDNTPDDQITIKANMVAAITAPVPRLDTKKNAYLVPSADYYLRFVDTLKFTDVYECIWGSNYEIREYLPKVFESLCKEAQLRNNRLGSLIHDINQTQPLKIPNNTIQQVYEEIKIDLLDEWDKFTRARKQETQVATVINFQNRPDKENIESVTPLMDKVDSGGVREEALGDVLELRKLGKPLKRFVEYRVTPLVMNYCLRQLLK